MNSEELTKLKSLLDDGVIDQDEYDSAIEAYNQQKVRLSDAELSKLKDLLDAGIIEQSVYDKAIGNAEPNKESVTQPVTQSSFMQKLLIPALCIAIVVLGFLYMNSLSALQEAQESASSLQDQKGLSDVASNNIKAALHFYLDNAGIVVEGERHYHRYDCSELPDGDYNFWIYNVDYAKANGYTECPVCFKDSSVIYTNRIGNK